MVASETVATTTFVVVGLECSEPYRFRVSAVGDGVIHSSYFWSVGAEIAGMTSDCLVSPSNATTTLSLLSAPSSLWVTSTSIDSVSLSWDAATGTSRYKD